MVKISKEPAPGVSEEERRKKFAKLGYDLRKHKQAGGFCIVKKRPPKKAK